MDGRHAIYCDLDAGVEIRHLYNIEDYAPDRRVCKPVYPFVVLRVSTLVLKLGTFTISRLSDS